MNGKYRSRKGSSGSGSRSGYNLSNRSKVLLKKTRAGLRKAGVMPKFATVGFSRNVEKKYFDKTYQANSSETLTGQTGGTGLNYNNGVTYISNAWGDYTFGTQQAGASNTSNDMLKGVATGTTARTRIGNKMRVNYVKGAFSFTAAAYNSAGLKDQNGEGIASLLTDSTGSYLRTTFRFVIVKDMQVNSTDTNITWQQVFDTTGQQAGVHSELNVDNMGRFIVLEDKIFTVDADTPQKTIPFLVSGGRLGSVRYNGPTGTALTDKGLYVVWAAFVMGSKIPVGDIELPSPVGHSRLCFTDD